MDDNRDDPHKDGREPSVKNKVLPNRRQNKRMRGQKSEKEESPKYPDPLDMVTKQLHYFVSPSNWNLDPVISFWVKKFDPRKKFPRINGSTIGLFQATDVGRT
jgi:hypothetical protein